MFGLLNGFEKFGMLRLLGGLVGGLNPFGYPARLGICCDGDALAATGVCDSLGAGEVAGGELAAGGALSAGPLSLAAGADAAIIAVAGGAAVLTLELAGVGLFAAAGGLDVGDDGWFDPEPPAPGGIAGA